MNEPTDSTGPGNFGQFGTASSVEGLNAARDTGPNEMPLSGQFSPSRELLIRQLENETAVFLKAKVWKAEHGDTDYRIAGPSMARLLRDARNMIAAKPAPVLTSRETEDRAKLFQRMSADPVAYLREAFADPFGGYAGLPSFTADAVARVLDMLKPAPDVAALTIKLADAERARDEFADQVKALSAPRIFNVAGMVEADLAERYESLVASYAKIAAANADLERRVENQASTIGGLQADTEKLERRGRHEREEVGKLAARVRVVEGERDEANERTAKARHASTALYMALHDQTALVDRLTDAVDRQADDIGGESPLAVVQLLGPQLADAHAALKLAMGFAIKPRCRVVTSPRFYSEEARLAAAGEVSKLAISRHGSGDTLGVRCLAYVDAAAEALGMRRAAK